MSDIDVGQALSDILSRRNDPPDDAVIANLAAELYLASQAHNALPPGSVLNESLAAVREARNKLFAALAKRPDLIG